MDVPWRNRAPSDEAFEARRKWLLDHGMMAKLTPHISDGRWPLVMLLVEPIDAKLMHRPPTEGNDWHISLAFMPVQWKLLRAFWSEWRDGKTVRLRFSAIGDNAVATLDPKEDPVASNPIVRKMHEADADYGKRPLHVTF